MADEQVGFAIGAPAPHFALPDTEGNTHALDDPGEHEATVVVWTCNHCPYALAWHERLIDTARDYAARNVRFLAINSNHAVSHPADSYEAMQERVAAEAWPHPYLHDESQEVAKAYRAACTPDFYLFDGNPELVYRGQLDGSRPDNGVPVSGADLRAALEAVLAQEAVSEEQKPSIGCNIKWRPGNAPEYFGP